MIRERLTNIQPIINALMIIGFAIVIAVSQKNYDSVFNDIANVVVSLR